MNTQRRKRLAHAQTLIAEGLAKLSEAKEIVEECRDEEQAYFDAMPESLQASPKGVQAQAVADALESAADALDADLEGDPVGDIEDAAS